jgi:hypothetical protein
LYAAEATGAAAGAAAGGSAAGLSAAVLAKTFAIGAVLGVAVASAVPVVRYVTRPASSTQVAALPSGAAAVREPRPRAPELWAAPVVADLPPASSAQASSAQLAVPAAAAEPASPRAPVNTPRPEAFTARPAAPSSPPEPPADPNRLRLEALELAKAKNLLEAGDARAALAVLDEYRARFAAGAMVEERDALHIEALAKLGEREQARAAARRFFVRFPKSPLADRVRRWSEPE